MVYCGTCNQELAVGTPLILDAGSAYHPPCVRLENGKPLPAVGAVKVGLPSPKVKDRP